MALEVEPVEPAPPVAKPLDTFSALYAALGLIRSSSTMQPRTPNLLGSEFTESILLFGSSGELSVVISHTWATELLGLSTPTMHSSPTGTVSTAIESESEFSKYSLSSFDLDFKLGCCDDAWLCGRGGWECRGRNLANAGKDKSSPQFFKVT